ncbi:MAG: hypothetical protein ACOX2A_08270 [Tepidanaerobacteraceae bacterium]
MKKATNSGNNGAVVLDDYGDKKTKRSDPDARREILRVMNNTEIAQVKSLFRKKRGKQIMRKIQRNTRQYTEASSEDDRGFAESNM